MLGRARIQAVWGNAPSADEIRKLDHQRLLQNPILLEPGSEDDLAMADALLQQRSPRDVAAAFVKLARALASLLAGGVAVSSAPHVSPTWTNAGSKMSTFSAPAEPAGMSMP